MARNIEIKARVADVEELKKQAGRVSGSEGELINQEDVFFNCPEGRIKLRFLSPEQGYLVYYTRLNQAGPKLSDYHISQTEEPEKLKNVLEKTYGVRAIVKKVRHLFLAGRTRIHVDTVEGLGDFMELEVVLSDSDSLEGGEAEARELMEKLGISRSDLIDDAYVDLLESREM